MPREVPRALRIASRAPGARLESAVAHRALDPEAAYRSPDGLALRIDPGDRFQRLMLLGRFDPVVVALVRRYARRGGIAIDAGAHLGYVSLHLARAVGPGGAVHAFECDPRLVRRAREHLALNGCAWATVHQLALSDRPRETAPFHLTEQLGWSSLDGGYWETVETVPVRMTSLDAHVAEHGIDPGGLTFVKVDVEGAEAAVLSGARATLEAARAPVLLEVSPERLSVHGRDAGELFGAMDDLGYEPWVARLGRSGEVSLTPGRVPEHGEDVLFLRR
jgi:FkbM family methyltransferase